MSGNPNSKDAVVIERTLRCSSGRAHLADVDRPRTFQEVVRPQRLHRP